MNIHNVCICGEIRKKAKQNKNQKKKKKKKKKKITTTKNQKTDTPLIWNVDRLIFFSVLRYVYLFLCTF